MNAAQPAFLDALYEAHVQHLMAAWQPDARRAAWTAEVVALWRAVEHTTPADWTTPDAWQAAAQQALAAAEPSAELQAALQAAATAAAQAVAADRTPFAERLPRPLFDQIVAAAAQLDDARNALLVQATSNRLYARLLADVLYHSFKRFMLEENMLAKKLPGASMLLKFNRRMVNNTLPGLEEAVDRQLIAHIQTNLQDAIQRSRHFLTTGVDEALIRELGEEIWRDLTAGRKPGAAAAPPLLNDADLALLGDLAAELWAHGRQTALVQGAWGAAAAALWQRYADQSIGAILTGWGVAPEPLADALFPPIDAWLAQPAGQAWLEERVRAQLATFYGHSAVRDLVNAYVHTA